MDVWADDSGIAPIAEPTDTQEIFTPQELIALILSSDVTYRIKGKSSTMSEEQVFTGKIKPVLDSFDSEEYTNEAGYLPFRFPIPEFQRSDPVIPSEFSLVFHFPFTVKQLNQLSCFVCPFVFYSGSPQYTPDYYHYFSIGYQVDYLGSVVDSFEFHPSSSSYLLSYSLSSGFSFRSFCDSSSSPAGLYFSIFSNSGSVLFRTYSSLISSFFDPSYRFLTGKGSDIDSWGFTWSPRYATGNGFPSNFAGIGFCFSPMAITYLPGGGYQSGSSGGGGGETDPGGGGETDPGGGGGSSPDYSAQLDKLYDELVKQGQITQEQNAAILQGQEDIKKGQQEILDAQKEQTEQDRQLWEDTFDPSEDDVGSLGDDIFSEDTQNDLKEKLGLFTFLDDTFEQLLDVFDDSGGSTSLRFPGLQVTINDITYQVIEPYDFDIAETLDKFDFLIAAIRFVNGIIIVFAFLAYLHHLKVRFFGDD